MSELNEESEALQMNLPWEEVKEDSTLQLEEDIMAEALVDLKLIVEAEQMAGNLSPRGFSGVGKEVCNLIVHDLDYGNLETLSNKMESSTSAE